MMIQKLQKEKKLKIKLKKKSLLMQSTNFENVFLSRKNQNILKSAFVEICILNGYKLPTLINVLIMNFCLNCLEETVHKHKFESTKLSWINMEVLSRMMKDMEDKKKNNYWEVTKLLKFERLENNKNTELPKINDFSTIKDVKPIRKSAKKISDLFDY